MNFMNISYLENTTPYGNPCFSGVLFGLARKDGTDSAQQVGILQQCREQFMYQLYAHIPGAPATIDQGDSINNARRIAAPFILKNSALTFNNALLLCKSEYYGKNASIGVEKLRNIPNVNFEILPSYGRTGIVLLSLPSRYFEIPILISYITLLIRVGSYIKGQTIEEIHKNAQAATTTEAMQLSSIPLSFVLDLFKNQHKIDIEAQNALLSDNFLKYGYYSCCQTLGINGVVEANSYSAMAYKKFLQTSLGI